MKTICLLSGGMDSAVLLWWLQAWGHEVRCLSVDYGQRHRRELQAAVELSRRAKVEHKIIDLHPAKELMLGSSQTDPSVPVPEGHYAEESMKLTIVPNRNMILLALAGAWAVSTKSEVVAYAAHAGDHAIYPDCRPEFAEVMDRAFQLCDWHPVRLWRPFVEPSKTKGDLARIGTELGVPFDLAWTCLPGDTEIVTLNGVCPILSLEPGDWVWGYSERGWTPSRVESFMVRGLKPVFEVVVKDAVGKVTSFKATGDHRLMLRQGGYARVDELDAGASLMQSSIHTLKVTRRQITDKTYLAVQPHSSWKEKSEYLHRIVAGFFGADLSGDMVVHHKDGDTFNNLPDNLEVLPRGEHSRLTDSIKLAGTPESRRRKSIKTKKSWASLTTEQYQARCAAISKGRRSNHRLVSVRLIGEELTYDIQTSTRNFALAAGIFVHNCYQGQEEHCGRCGSCCERREAFQLAGVTDPTRYKKNPSGMAPEGSGIGLATP